jgi:hypothetical protein
MLSETERILLTAYVDGELSARQQRQVQRLLHDSPEARSLLAKLLEDSRELHNLPIPSLGHDLAGAILESIAARRLSPHANQSSAARTFPTWVGVVAAALVLLSMGLGSYFYFSSTLKHPRSTAQGSDRDRQQAAQRYPRRRQPSTNPQPVSSQKPASAPAQPSPDRLQPPSALPQTSPSQKSSPLASDRARPYAPRHNAVLTGRMEMFEIDQVALPLPLVFKVHQLDQDQVRQKLVAELRGSREVRLELPSRNSARGLERFQAACQGLSIPLLIDPAAQERLRMTHLSGSFAIYLENVLPDELIRLLMKVSQEDRKVASRKPLEGQFDRLVLVGMTQRDHKELVQLLGLDPTQVAATVAVGPLDTNLRQPLPELTATQLDQALAGQGGVPRPGSSKPSPKLVEYCGLVLACNSGRPPAASAEIKRYLEARKAPRTGTLRILLVLRG